jgi:hypothetical protein
MYRLGMGALNCPGDPGCPGYVAPGSMDYQTSLLQEILANQAGSVQGEQAPTAKPAASSSWIEQNALWLGAGAFGLIVLLMAARPR